MQECNARGSKQHHAHFVPPPPVHWTGFCKIICLPEMIVNIKGCNARCGSRVYVWDRGGVVVGRCCGCKGTGAAKE
eukprot:3622459-Amphidinium_carterae.2